MVISNDKYLSELSAFKDSRSGSLKKVPNTIASTIVNAKQSGLSVSQISKASGLSKSCLYQITRRSHTNPITPPRKLKVKDSPVPCQQPTIIKLEIGPKVRISLPLSSLTPDLLKSLGGIG